MGVVAPSSTPLARCRRKIPVTYYVRKHLHSIGNLSLHPFTVQYSRWKEEGAVEDLGVFASSCSPQIHVLLNESTKDRPFIRERSLVPPSPSHAYALVDERSLSLCFRSEPCASSPDTVPGPFVYFRQMGRAQNQCMA